MWSAAGINKISVADLAVRHMVSALRRVRFFSSILRKDDWNGSVGFGVDLRGRTHGVHA